MNQTLISQVISSKNRSTAEDTSYLDYIFELDRLLYDHFKSIIRFDKSLTRQIVSFQANKKVPFYRWFKYKEAFSSALVKHLLTTYDIPISSILDPFAGAGTTLFASSKLGYNADGIELLPVSQHVINTRVLTESYTAPLLSRKI